MEKSEEITVSIVLGKDILVEFLNINEPDANGNRLVIFRINGSVRSVNVKDHSLNIEKKSHRKAKSDNEIGSPLQGAISDILVNEGDEVNVGDPLFIIEAMKMESTITSAVKGVVEKIHLAKRTLIKQDDLVVELRMD